MQTPYFNASMAPNGVMQVWTGLILRSQNEAQLAYVLGHEIGHYLRRHSVQRWRDVRNKSDILAVFSFATGGYGALLGQLVAIASIHAYSRDNEREADDVGFELMVNAGYDPREASLIWEALLKEKQASDESAPAIFFATHPPTEERIETLKGLAQKDMVHGRQYDTGTGRFLSATMPIRAMLLRDELGRHEFAQSQILLDRLIQTETGLGELYFYQGELYRLRAEPGDDSRAMQAYQKALEAGGAPVETHRALGLLFFKAGDKAKSRAAYERYLLDHPQANDREMIQSYMRQVE
jgi:predicted Zn-dependent protease